ncbi:hypothetical protein EGW08_009132 [Elysia chlorotica]|uniref:Small nuclear ribonucleoprotein G n=1 Tax=Elysia chlorotica TaxID=188477 RepID=A0A433TNI2_ELYCH|nr:hypothetical protein EGW08_009132 [Elysia chlorotica]
MSKAHPPELKKYMEKVLTLKLNGNRKVTGTLRGFDPFMNLVVDDSVEETKSGEKRNIGMVRLERPQIGPAWPVKLNGNRKVTGTLRGFDPFMNLVVDDSVEETKSGEKRNIGMVVIRGNSVVLLESQERV